SLTAWHVGQGGSQNKAVADLYGASHAQFVTDESGRAVAGSISFDNPNWSTDVASGTLTHRELVRIDPNNPPELNNNDAVGFDFEVGWATSHSNIHQDTDWFDQIAQFAMVGLVAWAAWPLVSELGAAAGAAVSAAVDGAEACTALGATIGGIAGEAATGATMGGVVATTSGMVSGNLSLKGIVQGVLAGGLTAGLLNGLGAGSSTPV